MPPTKQKFLSAAAFVKQQDAKYRARLPRRNGPGKNGRASRIPRALVVGHLYGPVTPAMYAVWCWAIGRGIDQPVSDQIHYENYGVVISWNAPRYLAGGPWRSPAALARVARLLHNRRAECGIEIISPYTGEVERLPLVLSCGWEDRPRGRNYGAGLRIELHTRVLKLISDYEKGYAPVDIQSMSDMRSVATQRMYSLAALHANRRFPFWSATPEDLAAIMGTPAARRDNVDAAIARAVAEIREIGFDRRNIQYSAIRKGKWIKEYEFELVWRALDITNTGRPRVREGYQHMPENWQPCLRRQIERIERGRRRKKPVPRDVRFDINLAATKRAVEYEGQSAWKLVTELTDYEGYVESYRQESENREAAESGAPLPHPKYAEKETADARLAADMRFLFDPPDPTPEEREAKLVAGAMDGDIGSILELEALGKLDLIPPEIVIAALEWWDAYRTRAKTA